MSIFSCSYTVRVLTRPPRSSYSHVEGKLDGQHDRKMGIVQVEA